MKRTSRTGSMNLAVKRALCMAMSALCFQTAQSVSWVVGDQQSGYTGMFIGLYNDWLVGNPRRVAYLFGNIDPQKEMGKICSGSWIQWATIGNKAPGHLDFKCVHSVADVSANSGHVGYYVGGLNLNGNTGAHCYMTNQTPELCDSDTITNGGSFQCIKYIKCE